MDDEEPRQGIVLCQLPCQSHLLQVVERGGEDGLAFARVVAAPDLVAWQPHDDLTGEVQARGEAEVAKPSLHG